MKPKILALDQGEHLGGAERFFSELLTHLEGFEIHLVSSGNAEYKKLYRGSSIIFHEVDLPKLKPITLNSYLQFRSTQKKLLELVLKIQPTKILSNTVRTHLLVSRIASSQDIPLVWMTHDTTFPKTFLRWFIRYPDTIISCSKYVQSYYKKCSNRKNLHFEILTPFGIDRKVLEKIRRIEKKEVIGMVGKFIPWKNQKTFIELAAEINHHHPEYRFVIVGSAYEGIRESEEYFSACKKAIRQKNLEGVLTIQKKVPDVMDEIATWEILIHCSNEPEPLGRVILEGMAAGCAVIASPFGGPGEIIRHRQTGILAKPNPDVLKKEVLELISHPEERLKMAQAGQEEVQEKYLWEKVMDQFTKIVS